MGYHSIKMVLLACGWEKISGPNAVGYFVYAKKNKRRYLPWSLFYNKSLPYIYSLELAKKTLQEIIVDT